MNMKAAFRLVLLAIFFGLLATKVNADDAAPPLKVGAQIKVDGRRGTVTKLDTLPLVESEYTKRFKFDKFANPKLKALRERYKLDEVVAPGKTEFDRQVLLLDWVNKQFKKFGAPTANPRGAAEILDDIEQGTYVLLRSMPTRWPPPPPVWAGSIGRWPCADPTMSAPVRRNTPRPKSGRTNIANG